MSEIFHIRPRWSDEFRVWVFDDRARGVENELFVGSTNDIIDYIVEEKLPTTTKEFGLDFSDSQFEGCNNMPIKKVLEEGGGCWYILDDESVAGWLCKIIYKYFQTPPDEIWFKVYEV